MNDIDRRMYRLLKGGRVNDAKDAKILRALQATDFEQSKHPRSPDGKFAPGGGSSAQPKQAKAQPARAAAQRPRTLSLARLMPKKTEKQIKPTVAPKNFYGQHTLKGTIGELNKWGNERSAAWKQYLVNPTRKNWRTVQKQYIDNPVDADPVQDEDPTKDGGPGSGNWGHKGRPGKRGGSGKGGGTHYREGNKEEGFKKKTLSLAEIAKKMQQTPRSTPFARKRGEGEQYQPKPQNAKQAPFERSKAQERTLKSIIRKTANLKKEQMRIVDQDGNILLQKQGKKGEVAATVGEKREFLKGNTSIHNHPDGGTFSPDDLTDFGYGARDIVVATPEGTYTLVNVKHGTKEQYDGWNDMKRALEDSVPKDEMGFSKVSALELRKQAREALKDAPENKEIAEMTARFAELQKTAPREEWIAFAESIKPRMDELSESLNKKVDAEVRRLETKPFDDFYKAHAAEYGFEYTFTPAKNVASQATYSVPEYATMGPQPIAKEGGNGYNNAKFNPDNYKRNQDGTVVVTDRLTASGHKGTSVPRQLRPFAVLQNIGGANRQTNRTFYDENGFICLQIHSRCHGSRNKYKDPDGFHAHDYIDGIRVRNAGNVNPDGRECTEQQKRMCGDLR